MKLTHQKTRVISGALQTQHFFVKHAVDNMETCEFITPSKNSAVTDLKLYFAYFELHSCRHTMLQIILRRGYTNFNIILGFEAKRFSNSTGF